MNKTVIALGFFDGVHLGHRVILNTAVHYAKEHGLVSAACTFDRHPRAFIRGIAPAMLSTPHRRAELIAEQGIERVEIITFDKEMAEMSADDFVVLLKERYGCVAAVCGDDFRFGKMAKGDADTLRQHGIETIVCPPVIGDGERISSTRIRHLLSDGRVFEAGKLLGREYSLFGVVVDGFKRGRRIGVPTMNLRPDKDLLIPGKGVYASFVIVGGQKYIAVTNVGTRPTFSQDDIISVESFIIGFNSNIYGEVARVEFFSKLREERRFNSEEELIAQIEEDIKSTRKILGVDDI